MKILKEKEFYNNFCKTKIFEDFIKRKYYYDNDEESKNYCGEEIKIYFEKHLKLIFLK